MEEVEQTESHLTSAAAFVEGGVQEACEDSCSICLDVFCENDPSTVTTCKHEFHLQCILEWCQRSSHCPMCWQAISLKDPTSQELLEVVERERSYRFKPSRNSAIFHHPALGDFELQHLPVGANDAELEERIIQHLAAAAALGRAHNIRREGQRIRLPSQGRPQYLVFSTNHNTPPGPVSASSAEVEGDEPSVQRGQVSASGSGSRVIATSQPGGSFNTRSSVGEPSPSSQVRDGPSEFQSFSDSLKSRLNAASIRYKESISKSTKGWKERLFSRTTSMGDIGSEVRREVHAGIASVSRMMECLETRGNSARNHASLHNNTSDASVLEQNNTETSPESPLNDAHAPASHATSSLSD